MVTLYTHRERPTRITPRFGRGAEMFKAMSLQEPQCDQTAALAAGEEAGRPVYPVRAAAPEKRNALALSPVRRSAQRAGESNAKQPQNVGLTVDRAAKLAARGVTWDMCEGTFQHLSFTEKQAKDEGVDGKAQAKLVHRFDLLTGDGGHPDQDRRVEVIFLRPGRHRRR
jgi:hypothetical protein